MATTGNVTKLDWERNPNRYVFNTLATETLGPVTVGAGIANTVVQQGLVMTVPFKIVKVGVFFTSIDAGFATDAFNLVVGTAAYTSNATSLAQNDNSFSPNPQGAPTGQVPQVGYPTNVAVAGNTVFGADLNFTVANGFTAVATTGGYGVLVPPNYDAVYPGNLPITLRTTTNASTGAIGNLTVTMLIEPVTLREDWFTPGSPLSYPIPGVSF